MQNKKFLKLNIVRFMCVMLILALSNFSFAFKTNKTYATDENLPVITLQSKTGENAIHRGQTFTLDIILSNNTNGLSALFLTISTYNKSAFKLVNVKQGTALSTLNFDTTNSTTSAGFDYIDPVTGGFNLLWEGDNSKSEGVIATLTFQSFITAELGDYNIILTYQKSNTRIAYQQETEIVINNSIVSLATGEFRVVYKDYDNSVLWSKDCMTDDIPSYPYSNPTRAETDEYTFVFAAWKGVVSANENEITYQATYTQTAKEYTIFLYVDYDNGEGLTYFNAINFDFGETINISVIPTLSDHNFAGWFADNLFKTKLTSPYMPAKNITLYGYFTFNIRETEIPKIALSYDQTVGNVAYVGVSLTENTGLNALVFSPSYDRENLTLIGYESGEIFSEMSFNHTYAETEADYGVQNFKFMWESSTNNYETGKLIILKFKLKDDLAYGNYDVTVTYNDKTDATYIETDLSIWYSKLDITAGVIPIGLRYHWNEVVDGDEDVDIDIVTDDGKPFNVEFVVDDITKTAKKSMDNNYVASVIGDNKKISAVYSSKLSLNNSDYDANTLVHIKIKLTDDQKESESLSVYSLDENGTMSLQTSEVVDGYLSFSSIGLTDWAIVCDKASVVDGKIGQSTFTLILMPTILAIATMATFLIYWGKKRKIS